MPGRCAGLLLFFTACVISSSALAQPPKARMLVFETPPQCGTKAEFTKIIERRLERVVVPTMLEGFGLEIQGESEGYTARIQLAEGQRLIRGVHCRDVVEAAAMIIAIAIGVPKDDITAKNNEVQATTDNATAASPEVASPEVASPEDASPEVASPEVASLEVASLNVAKIAPKASSTWSSGIGGNLTADLGTVADVGLVGGASLWLASNRWRAEVGAGVFHPRANRLAPNANAGAEVRLWMATASACRSSGRLALCTGGEAGVMRADGFGFESSRRAELTWWAWTTSLRIAVPISDRVTGVSSLQVVLPYAPPRFTDDAGMEVYASAPLILRVGFGVEADLF